MKENSYLNDYIQWINAHKLPANCSQDNMLDKHHVIPRALGGTDSVDNIARLTTKDHVIAHEMLFNVLLKCTIQAAHTLVSMVGKTSCSTAVAALDSLDERTATIEHFRKLQMKKTVYNAATLKPHKIKYLDSLPAGYIEKPAGAKAFIFNASNGCTTFWPKDAIPPGWKSYAEATDAEKQTYFPGIFAAAAKNKQRAERRQPMKWICNVVLKTSKLVPKESALPAGWQDGIYYTDEQKAKCKAGGMQIKAKLEAISNNGYRWIHNVATCKNKLIGKDDMLPAGYVEGMYNKKIAELQQQIKQLQP